MNGRRFGVDVDTAKAAEQVQYPQSALPYESFIGLPAPTGAPPYRLELSSIGVADPTDQLVFHVIGDHGGIKDPGPQQAVAAALVADPATPDFLYSVGDIVYFNGDHSEYLPQFYEPYNTYPHPIFAIPGNHDGDNSDDPTVPSLGAFVTNFCSRTPPAPTPDAGDMHRDPMTQPNVYWTLVANLVTIIGCYSNVPSGGEIDQDQQDWLAGELAAAPTDRALIVALHHPPYSIDAHHGGSALMGQVLDAAFAKANRKPEIVLAGHVHDYQRFVRNDGTVYVVSGNGGYHNLHAFSPDAVAGQPVSGSDVTFEAGDDSSWGFLRLTVTAEGITGVASSVGRTGPASIVDQFTIPLKEGA